MSTARQGNWAGMALYATFAHRRVRAKMMLISMANCAKHPARANVAPLEKLGGLFGLSPRASKLAITQINESGWAVAEIEGGNVYYVLDWARIKVAARARRNEIRRYLRGLRHDP